MSDDRALDPYADKPQMSNERRKELLIKFALSKGILYDDASSMTLRQLERFALKGGGIDGK
jgi:hypothetical protein